MDTNNIKIYVYCDESGLLHTNANKRYFSIGGYFAFPDECKIIKTKYARTLKKIKIARNFSKSTELKTHLMTNEEKIKLFSAIQSVDSFHGFALILDKESLNKPIEKENVFYNYLIMIIMDRIILPAFEEYDASIDVEIDLFPDNRNCSVQNLKSLEDYLNTFYYMNDRFSFNVQYCNSAHNYNIQIADLIANTFYMMEKDKTVVSDVLDKIALNKFYVTHFPGSYSTGTKHKYK